MNTLTLTIRTPERELLHKEVQSVSFHSETGKVSFLAHHGDYTGSMQYTRVLVADGSSSDTYIGRRGLATFDNKTNHASLLFLECHPLEEVSPITAEAYLKYVEEQLRSGADLSTSQLKFMEEEKIMLVKQIKDLEE